LVKKNEYTQLNAVYRSYGEIKEVEKTEPVSLKDLLAEKEEIENYNKKEAVKLETINFYKTLKKRFKEHIDENSEHFNPKALNDSHTRIIQAIESEIINLPEPKLKTSELDTVNKKISDSEEINRKASEYEKYILDKKAKDDQRKKLKKNKQEQQNILNERLEYIKKKDLPFNNLEIDEGGNLLLNGKPIKQEYFSTGELLKVIPILISSQNPELKYVFLKYFNLLDAKRQNEVEQYLVSKGFQLCIEYVTDTKIEGKNCILLKQGQIVDSYEENESETPKLG
jgi:hypothetical protein